MLCGVEAMTKRKNCKNETKPLDNGLYPKLYIPSLPLVPMYLINKVKSDGSDALYML